MKKRIFGLCGLALLGLMTSCGEVQLPIESTVEESKITSIDILKDSSTVDELEAKVGDQIQLSYNCNDGNKPNVEWSSSDESILTIDDSGKVTVVGKGTAIVSVAVSGKTYIEDSIFITCKNNKIYQSAVGSGKTPYDPIFIGNEGENEPIEVYFMEMQRIYGDTIFIKKGNVEVLIDAGYPEDGSHTAEFLKEKCTDGRIDLYMISHADGDHIEGVSNELKDIGDISLMIDYGGKQASNDVKATREKADTYYSAYECANHRNGASQIYYLTSEFYVEIVNTHTYIKPDESTTASNPYSVTAIFHYKDFSFFSGGDITESTEELILKYEELENVTLYKASHHGSHGSNTQAFMNALNPKYVGISAARAGTYGEEFKGPDKNKTYNLNAASGHPAAQAIERIYKIPNISKNLNVYWNAVNGTMKFTSYGENDCTFQGSTPIKGYYDYAPDGKGYVTEPIWDEAAGDWKNKVTGEENYKLHEAKVFTFRDYIQYLPTWAQQQYYPDYKK